MLTTTPLPCFSISGTAVRKQLAGAQIERQHLVKDLCLRG